MPSCVPCMCCSSAPGSFAATVVRHLLTPRATDLRLRLPTCARLALGCRSALESSRRISSMPRLISAPSSLSPSRSALAARVIKRPVIVGTSSGTSVTRTGCAKCAVARRFGSFTVCSASERRCRLMAYLPSSNISTRSHPLHESRAGASSGVLLLTTSFKAGRFFCSVCGSGCCCSRITNQRPQPSCSRVTR